jgi:hypothetical protein
MTPLSSPRGMLLPAPPLGGGTQRPSPRIPPRRGRPTHTAKAPSHSRETSVFAIAWLSRARGSLAVETYVGDRRLRKVDRHFQQLSVQHNRILELATVRHGHVHTLEAHAGLGPPHQLVSPPLVKLDAHGYSSGSFVGGFVTVSLVVPSVKITSTPPP